MLPSATFKFVQQLKMTFCTCKMLVITKWLHNPCHIKGRQNKDSYAAPAVEGSPKWELANDKAMAPQPLLYRGGMATQPQTKEGARECWVPLPCSFLSKRTQQKFSGKKSKKKTRSIQKINSDTGQKKGKV